ncbi:MAG: histidine--tRNA ligase [Planctomycetota bacterium]
MAAAIQTAPVKGVRDVYPDDMRVRSWLFGQWRAVARQFGYEEYDACVLESAELYIRKAGDEITGQLYDFQDKGGRHVALRPEMTPTLARMLMARGGSTSLPARWFSIPQCFRYERMQKGRKREHYQWNMDCIGLDHVAAEVELMTAQAAFLERVGLRGADVAFKVSDRRVLQHFLAGLGITDAAFATVCVIIDKRDKVGDTAVLEMLQEAGVDTPTGERICELLDVRGLERLAAVVGADNPGYACLAELLALADAAGIADRIHIDCSVVRGLSYYTGTVWELFDTGGAVPLAIAGGGRYDGLMEHLGGMPTPMVGFGFGDVVISLILEERGLIPQLDRGIDAVVYPMSAAEFPIANRIATQLRSEGQQILVDYSRRRFKHVVRAAEDAGAATLWILGTHEREQGVIKKRSLADRSEETVALDDFC